MTDMAAERSPALELTALAPPRRQDISWLWPLLFAGAGTGLLWLSRKEVVLLPALLCAYIILAVPLVIFQRWTRAGRRAEERITVPILFFIAAIFVVNFAVSLFWSRRSVSSIDTGDYFVSPESVSQTMVMAVVALAAIYCGVRSRIGGLLVTRNILDLRPGPQAWSYIRAILLVGMLLSHFERAATMGGAGGRQLILALQTDVPLCAFALIYRQFLQGRASRVDAAILLLYMLNTIVVGISSGWLGSLVLFAIVAFAVYIGERRRVPVAPVLLLIAYTVFMQPGKEDFRKAYGIDQQQTSKIERIGYWVNASLQKWSEALSGTGQTSIADVLGQTTGRTSMVAVTAQILEFTPEIVPFQNGSTYSFLLVSVIPRALWPNKPSANEVNRWYQVNYRLTEPDDLEGVSLAPGLLGEAYINFGWSGVVLIFLLLGILYDYLQRQFGTRSRGLVYNAVAVVLLRTLVLVEFHMAEYVGGLLQEILVMLLVLSPMLYWRPARPEATPEASLSALVGAPLSPYHERIGPSPAARIISE